MTTLKVFLFHPAFIHFPIAFAFFELGLLLVSCFRGDETAGRFAAWTGRVGYFSLLPAAASGFMSLGGLNKVDAVTWPHVSAGLILFVWWTLRLCFERFFQEKAKFSILAFSAVTCALVMLTAYRGGNLVY